MSKYSNPHAALDGFLTPHCTFQITRYVLLVYSEPPNFQAGLDRYFAGRGDVTIPWSPARLGFNVTDFAARMNLGEPLAGNFFLTGPDSETAVNQTATNTTSTPATTSGRASPSVTALSDSAHGRGGAETMTWTMKKIAVICLAALLMSMH